ncbi:ferritin family protein [Agrobacterium tumefaciens]|uniref:ferritin-like domain-containing protein n=1 Tax=Agrobacterium tumefaciens TaxID=358 RepID=UPI0015727A24|nr:ferritin family protein [Agrobacterium tumefaciens]NTA84515.1 ferritin family protein [Agrobacterium tumefaciens]
MSATNSEPWEFASLDALLAIAGAMEKEAIDGYAALSKRMAEMGRLDLAQVFDALVLEESGHLRQVQDWREASGYPQAKVEAPANLYDDDGAGLVAPEMLSAYRAFSMAVRNEERAFMFWTYVSADAQSQEIKQAAERMAREELGHVAKLRSERRRAFHTEKALRGTDADPGSLEARLSARLEALAINKASEAYSLELQRYAEEAQSRMGMIAKRRFEIRPTRGMKLPAAGDSALALSELLLDCYLDIADNAVGEHDADRARAFAAQIIASIRTVRGVVG